jgi:uncharacterized membrane protein YedE/YeeE
MSILSGVIIGLLMGVVFGFAFEKSRMMEPGSLIGQFQFRRFIMMKMLFAAVATSLVVLAVLHGSGLVQLSVKPALIGNMVVGGLLLGVGIVMTGSCPGTAAAQIGAGYKDAWATVFGGLIGAAIYGYNQTAIDKALDWSGIGFGNLGKMTLVNLVPGGFVGWALGIAALLVVAMFLLERAFPWRGEIAADEADTDASASKSKHAGGRIVRA